MSRSLMRQVRAEESRSRLGGDEFLIVLTGENAGGRSRSRRF
jgi:GGDEF domain-containing protein